MKSLERIRYFVLSLVTCLFMAGCNKDVTDFGFDRSLSGKIVTTNGKIVAGDITNNTLYVQALGDGDIVPSVIRVKGDGTYANAKLFPNIYKVWITGAVKPQETDTIVVDLSSKNEKVLDFTVNPYLTITPPVVNGSPTSTSVDIDYAITANFGYVSKTRNIYCGTYPYPNGTIGSGQSYSTIAVSLTKDAGTVKIEGLRSKTKYYIRIGATANSSNFQNFSEQTIITTP